MGDESEKIKDEYIKRDSSDIKKIYNPLLPNVYLSQQEKERKIIQLLSKNSTDLNGKTLLEVGAGNGMNILQMIRLGFKSNSLSGNEITEHRYLKLRQNVPENVSLYYGDASKDIFDGKKFDIIYQSTVFSSLLEDKSRIELATNIWEHLSKDGAILWYDFTYDNPKNSHVRGVKEKEIKKLFPYAKTIESHRIVLAPPISRFVCRLSPKLYGFFNSFPFLRTHLICWIQK